MLMYGVGFCLFCWTTFVRADPKPLFLTPYIKNNTAAEGRNLSSVDASQFLGVTSYSGYITVDEEHKSHLFFWYFPVANANVSETPLIVWLQGGPGGTSLVGAFLEIGPIGMNGANDSVLFSRPTSWGVNHSLLFIDNPVGTGLSFTETGNYVTNLSTCAEHLYSFLQQFLTIYPELRAAPLFISGESYAGRYVPAFAKKVYDIKESHEGDRKINIQGLIMGNPLFNYKDTANISQIFFQWGLIDQQGLLSVRELQEDYVAAIKKNDSNAQELHENLLDKLQGLSAHDRLYNVLKYDKFNFNALSTYINNKEFKEKVHGAEVPVNIINGDVQRALHADFLLNMDSTMTFLLEHYRILIYCGQLDLTEPCVPNAEGRRRNWHWSKRAKFLKAPRKPISEAPYDVAGYVKSGGGLTEVLVTGAGHLVPMDKPKEVQMIISYFVRAEELPSNTNPYGINYNVPLPDLDYTPNLSIFNKSDDDTPLSSRPNDDTQNNTNPSTPNGTNPLKPSPDAVINESNSSNSAIDTSPLSIVSWILNGILIVAIIVCGVLYWRHRRRYRDYFLDDEDSLNNAMLTMS